MLLAGVLETSLDALTSDALLGRLFGSVDAEIDPDRFPGEAWYARWLEGFSRYEGEPAPPLGRPPRLPPPAPPESDAIAGWDPGPFPG